jgi:Ca2+-binding RTX toxin-like protein
MEDFDDSEIDWGDGTVEPATVVETPGSEGVPTTGTATGGHMYASGGIFTITVTVTDDDSGSDSIELIALVTGAGLNGGEVQVVGTDFQDVVNVKKKGETIEVMAGFIAAGKVAFPLTDVDKLRVLVCDGDDQVHVNHQLTMPAILEGDAGRDHLQAGSGSTMIEGGADDDHLWGGNADDFIYADEGNDFLFGGRGNDMLFGGPGDDTLFGQHDDDVLDGGAGLDRCNGGRGDDSAANCEAGTPALALGGPATG